ncbi:hypothetical protein D9611_005392 [Ephemerocybe angulata]|uniref:Aminotransferase class I/classII large domain-containing protein n=1 Tax=Ephemerocybe angulata TaxID=980116 RepID=A0A8H5C0D8_9AGAR|nr:hypothetical protein D9611_005392 [Tulosesus angulatus]
MSSALGFSLSKGVLNTSAPPIPKAYEWAARYNETSSTPLIDMSQGVPGIPPPEELRQAIGEASASPQNFSYGRSDGEPALRLALVDEMKALYGLQADIKMEDVALTAGCNMAFMAVIMALADAGDEVILPFPWYFNHEMDLSLLGVKAIGLPTLPEDGFLPSIARCEALITTKTKAIALVTPNNPTGAIYPPSLIASYADLATKHRVPLIVDETYRDFVPPEEPPHTLFTPSDSHPWRRTFIHLFSFSKSYCLPGYRLGAIVASPEFLASVKTVLDCLQICPPRPVQLGLAPLMPSLRNFVQANGSAIRARHALFREALPQGWEIGAQGGYFAFVRHPYTGIGGERLAQMLVEKEGLLALPATFFMPTTAEGLGQVGDGYVTESGRWLRFSVANVDDKTVLEACERLASFDAVSTNHL